jgi:hypothetical protein
MPRLMSANWLVIGWLFVWLCEHGSCSTLLNFSPFPVFTNVSTPTLQLGWSVYRLALLSSALWRNGPPLSLRVKMVMLRLQTQRNSHIQPGRRFFHIFRDSTASALAFSFSFSEKKSHHRCRWHTKKYNRRKNVYWKIFSKFFSYDSNWFFLKERYSELKV